MSHLQLGTKGCRFPMQPGAGCIDSRFGYVASSAPDDPRVILARQSKSPPFEVCQWRDEYDRVLSLAIGCSSQDLNRSPGIVGISQRLDGAATATISLLDPRVSRPQILPTPTDATDSYGSDLVYGSNHWLVCEPTGYTNIPFSGKVWVLNATDGSVRDILVPDSAGPYDMFGNCIDAHSEFVAIGAPLQDQPLLDSGAVHIYRWSGDVLEPMEVLVSGSPQTSGWFGSSVQFLDDDLLAVGAPGEGSSGLVEFFQLDGGRWIFKARHFSPRSTYSRFGFAISSIGRDLFIGEKSQGASWLHFRREENCDDTHRFVPIDVKGHPIPEDLDDDPGIRRTESFTRS